jgi:predicted SAM-dependent methyltransferase
MDATPTDQTAVGSAMIESSSMMDVVDRPETDAIRTVLNVGSGSYAPDRLHPAFRNSRWREIRYDIDTRVKPDIVGSITNMAAVPNGSCDAIWSSHNVEHLHTYEVPKALSEFHRVLSPGGFALITTPDVESIAELVVAGRLEDTAYQSPAGPITALDMLFGLSSAIAAGNHFMAHNTAFTADRLGRLLIDAGFAEAFTKRGASYDIWAVAVMPEANIQRVLSDLRAGGLDLFPEAP